jgi:uncharacterized protein HemX
MEGIISAIVGVAGVVVGALITNASQQRKVKAESVKAEAEAARIKADENEQIRKTVMSLIEPLQEQINKLEQELEDWKNWADRLVTQIKGLGCEPVPFKQSKVKRKP